jgi:hypothetical protein
MTDCSCTKVQGFRGHHGHHGHGHRRPGFGNSGNRGRNSRSDSLIDLIGTGRLNNNNDFEDDGINSRILECPDEHVNKCGVPKNNNNNPDTRLTKGEYCIDYDVEYDGGDQFKRINKVGNAEECRKLCVNEPACNYYTYKGTTNRKPCFLKKTADWIPKLGSGSVSGTIDGLCKNQQVSEYLFCECVELEPDYYDDTFIDLVETGLINPRSGICPPEQGKRCYSTKQPIRNNGGGGGTSSRIHFG